MKIRIVCSGGGLITWRDHWERKALVREFRKRGHVISDDIADVEILLYGSNNKKAMVEASPNRRKFCWVISHPDRALQQRWDRFEYVWIRSKYLADMFDIPNKAVILGGTMHKFKPRKGEPTRDIVMLGNWKPPRPEVITMLVENGYKLGLAGDLEHYVPDYVLKQTEFLGPWLPNEKIIDFYNTGKLYLRVCAQDMRQHGMIAQATLEVILNSETLLLHETNPGLIEVAQSIPTYDDFRKDLLPLIDKYLKMSQEERDTLVAVCREEASDRTSFNVVTEMEKFI